MSLVSVTSLDFARTSRRIANAAREGGLVVPVFRTPPSRTGLDRTVRVRPNDPPVVAVRLGGRPHAAVCADLVDGVIAVNQLDVMEATRWRRVLWDAVTDDEHRVGAAA